MEFNIAAKDFATELSLVMSAVETKATLPVAGLVKLDAVKNAVVVTATNLEFGIRVKIPADIKSEGVAILDADRLHSWLSRLQEGEVSAKVNKRASLKSGRSSCSLQVAESVSFPEFPVMGKPVASVPGEVLAKLLTSVSFTIGGFENANFSFSGAKFEVSSTEMSAVATGGNRMAVSQCEGSFETEGFHAIIPKKAVSEVAKLSSRAKGGIVRVYGDKNNVFFGFGDRLIYSRCIAGSFPNWRKSLPREESQKVVVFPAATLIDALDRTGALSDSVSKRSIFNLSEGTMTIQCSSEAGDSSESIDAAYSGDDISLGLNYSWLIDGLKAAGDGNAEFRFIDSRSPIEIRIEGQKSYRYVVAQMEVTGKEKAA